MPAGATAGDLMAEVEALRVHLREILDGKDPAVLSARPANGDRSILENLRHMLFAEEAHLGALLPGGPRFSELGLPPPGIQRQERFAMTRDVDTSAGEVFARWETAHVYTRDAAEIDTESVRKAIARHLKHQRSHAQVIERLLRAAERSSRSGGR
jgi:hypothetical protein